MITQLQNFFLKHNKWLFGSLLVVIIVTFVLTIGPQSIFDGPQGGQNRQKMEFYGFDLANPGQQQAVIRRAELSMGLNPELRIPRDQLLDYAYLRLAGLGIADQLGIPNPTRDQLADFVATISIFQNPESGEFSPETYNQIVESLEGSATFSRELLGTVLREDFRIARVREALGGADLSMPEDVKEDFIDMEASYSFVMATFNEADFNPEIDVEDAEVEQFFRENPSRYEIPERIEVTALLFNADTWMDAVEEPAEDAARAYFQQNLNRYQPAPDPDSDEQPAEVTFDDVSDRVITDLKRESARKVAEEKSSQFTLRLWNEKIAKGSPEYETLIEEFRAQAVPLPPYARENAPRSIAPKEMLDSMWVYVDSSWRYFSDIASTSNGAAVGILNGYMEARMPEFEEVRDQVTEDYIQSEKRRLFTERGSEIHDILQANTGDFRATAEDLGLGIQEMDTFTGRNVPFQIRFNGVWEQIQFLNEGEVSQMIVNNNRGTFAFLESKEVPAVEMDSEEFVAFAEERRNSMKNALGWIRLREITDTSLTRLLGDPLVQ